MATTDLDLSTEELRYMSKNLLFCSQANLNCRYVSPSLAYNLDTANSCHAPSLFLLLCVKDTQTSVLQLTSSLSTYSI